MSQQQFQEEEQHPLPGGAEGSITTRPFEPEFHQQQTGKDMGGKENRP